MIPSTRLSPILLLSLGLVAGACNDGPKTDEDPQEDTENSDDTTDSEDTDVAEDTEPPEDTDVAEDTEPPEDTEVTDDTDVPQDTDVPVALNTVRAVQTGLIPQDSEVTVENVIVTSPDSGSGFFVQDASGATHAGVWVYYGGVASLETAGVAIGDMINLTGTYVEFASNPGDDTLTQLTVTSETAITVVSSGNPLPYAISLTDTNFEDETILELYEGMLVTVSDVTATSERQFGEYVWNDVIITDNVFFDLNDELEVVDGFTADSITGNLYFSYDNFKLVPHDADSFVNVAYPL